MCEYAYILFCLYVSQCNYIHMHIHTNILPYIISGYWKGKGKKRAKLILIGGKRLFHYLKPSMEFLDSFDFNQPKFLHLFHLLNYLFLFLLILFFHFIMFILGLFGFFKTITATRIKLKYWYIKIKIWLRLHLCFHTHLRNRHSVELST